MPSEPTLKRASAFIDGQNLFHACKDAFGYTYPNYDVQALASAICRLHGWDLSSVYFCTGYPSSSDDTLWHGFWQNKLLAMSRSGIVTFSRQLRYRNEIIKLKDGTEHTILVGREKGIDVRLALDVIRSALRNEYDVALIFSQDQDLSEVADEIRAISGERNRWIKVASAFPTSPTIANGRGINKTDWIKISKQLYDSCIDVRDYRVKP